MKGMKRKKKNCTVQSVTRYVCAHSMLIWSVRNFVKMAVSGNYPSDISSLNQGPLNIWTEHSNCQIHNRRDSKNLAALLIPNIFLNFFMKLFFYAYKNWGHDTISCLCRKFSELRALLFLSSTQTSQNLKFIKKCPCLSSLKTKFQWTQIKFWPLDVKFLRL